MERSIRESLIRAWPSMRFGGVFVLAAVLLTAVIVGAQAAPTITEQEQTRPARESIARGQAIVEGACSTCHGLDLVEEQRLSREEWGYVIQAMLANGSDLTDREIPFVLDYLSTAFPAAGAGQ